MKLNTLVLSLFSLMVLSCTNAPPEFHHRLSPKSKGLSGRGSLNLLYKGDPVWDSGIEEYKDDPERRRYIEDNHDWQPVYNVYTDLLTIQLDYGDRLFSGAYYSLPFPGLYVGYRYKYIILAGYSSWGFGREFDPGVSLTIGNRFIDVAYTYYSRREVSTVQDSFAGHPGPVYVFASNRISLGLYLPVVSSNIGLRTYFDFSRASEFNKYGLQIETGAWGG